MYSHSRAAACSRSRAVFCDLKPYPSWVLDTTTYWYDSPIGSPQEDNVSVEIDGVQTEFTGRSWEEDNQRWVAHISNEDAEPTEYFWNTSTSAWEAL